MPSPPSPSEIQIEAALRTLIDAVNTAGNQENAQRVFAEMKTTILRLVFCLCAKGRGLRIAENGLPRALSDTQLLDSILSDDVIAAARAHLSDGVCYETLDVQDLGTVYQVLMGFSLRRSAGAFVLQAGTERRTRGSHYTPRALSAPIVERTLAPLLYGPCGDQVPSTAKILALNVCDPAMGAGAFLVEAARYLARELVGAGEREGAPVSRSTATRLVVEHCVYGVDKDPLAVSLARLSVWLLVRSRACPFSFVDRTLRTGDALLGLRPAQIARFSFAATGAVVDKTGDWRDQLIACVWAGGTDAQIRDRIAEMRSRLQRRALPERLPLPVQPLHWERVFPEVWRGARGGFDAVLGNPPFGGQNTINAQHGEIYIRLLRMLWPHAHGGADLAAYFFLLLPRLLRRSGCAGFISTNTIAQGNTRETGLKKLLADGLVRVFAAETDQPWPVGDASITVSTVFLTRDLGWAGPIALNGAPVSAINSFLQAGAERADPVRLSPQPFVAARGTEIYGNGFVLAQAEVDRLIANDPHNAACLVPYVGGKELNRRAEQDAEGCVLADKHVICFRDLSLAESSAWPELLAIVRERVKPGRDRLGDNASARHRKAWWWQFGRYSPQLYEALSRLSHCFCCARVSKHLLIARQPAGRIFSDMVVVFPTEDWADFAVLQSGVHALWAAQFSSTMRDAGTRYSPTRCFERFPFPPPEPLHRARLREAGARLYQHRSQIMRQRGLGMTQVWNLLHSAGAHEDIAHLRRLRDALDRAVLAAYGWSELAPSAGAEVVDRLWALNAQRAGAQG